MTHREKYVAAFVESFGVKEDQVPDLKYQAVAAWDSVGHMGLIAAIEDAFDIQFETDDIVDFSSFEKGIELLKKYGIEIE